YPEPPFKQQHVEKPGHESALELSPMYDAPYYRGSGKLDRRVAIVTGGDSGIGRAVGTLFAREGADVVIVYLNEHDDAEVTKQVVEREGRRCESIAGDVADAEFCDAVIAKTIGAFHRIDVLVNNAAFQMHARTLEELTLEHFDHTVKTNL